MNDVFALLAGLLLHLSMATGPHQSLTTSAEREAPAPTTDPLERAAAGRTAYLADMLRLRYIQARQLKQHTYQEYQELQWLSDSGAVASRVAATAAVDARYHRQLTKVLSPGQYATLLRLEDEPSAQLVVRR
jgi:hypothetical protein